MLIRKVIVQSVEETAFSPKEISFKNSLRIIRNFILTKKVEFTTDGLQVNMQKLKLRIAKSIIRIRPNRNYPRITKTGAYKNINKMLY